MTGKQRKTLTAVFRDPVSGTIEWAALEGLLIAAGARVIEGRGSRVRFEKDGEVETFHRPHPTKEAKRYQIRAARAFLERMGDHTMTNTMTYKGYSARIDYDDDDSVFTGRIAGIRDGVGFHADTVDALREAFHEAVEGLYRDLCRDRQATAETLFGPDDVSRQPRSTPPGRARGGTVRQEPEPVGRRSTRPCGTVTGQK